MLMDVFSNFDDKNFNMFYFGAFEWSFSLLVCTLIYNSNIWFKCGYMYVAYTLFISFGYSMTRNVKGGLITGFPFVLVTLFMMYVFVNMSNCFPYFFPLSCHGPFALLFSFGFWLSILFSSAWNGFPENVAAFVPSGCPSVILIFMVLVETLSNCIRPFTLTMRLIFNMATGQVVLSLSSEAACQALIHHKLGFSSFYYEMVFSFVLFTALSFFFLFEICVSFLQSYIFCMLLCMYTNDHSDWYD